MLFVGATKCNALMDHAVASVSQVVSISAELLRLIKASLWCLAAVLVLVVGVRPALAVGTADGNIGIGTAAPLSMLDVAGGLAVGTYAETATAPSNGAIISGVVGIMTSNPSPGAVLDLGSATGTAFSSLVLPTGTSGTRPTSPVTGMIRLNSGTPGIEAYYNDDWQPLFGNDPTAVLSNPLNLGTATSTTSPRRTGSATTGLFSSATGMVGIAVSGTEELRITATSVGIGTSSPSQALDVAGSINISATGRITQGGNTLIVIPTTDIGTVAVGPSALASMPIATLGRSVAIGTQALQNATTTGVSNIAAGYQVLQANTTGFSLTAVGHQALTSNTIGNSNTAIGSHAMQANTSGVNNTAVGIQAMSGITINNGCAMYGMMAARSLVTGATNSVAVGYLAAFSATIGGRFVGVGNGALYQFTTPSTTGNTAVGYQAMYGATGISTGTNSTALGYESGFSLTTGSSNSFLGYWSASNVTSGGSNVVLGANAAGTLTTGASNIIIGQGVDVPAASSSNWLNIGGLLQGNTSTGVVAIGKNTITAGSILDLGAAAGTAQSSMILPQDTTANRPSSPVVGMMRYNTTDNILEGYLGGSATGWNSLLINAGTAFSGTTVLGSSTASTSPSRNGDLTTGLFSAAASTVSVAASGSEILRVSPTGLGIFSGSSTISSALSFGPGADRTIDIARRTVDAPGNSLTLQAGAAFSGGTDKAGGNLVFRTGTGTGTGGANIIFNVTASGNSGTADRAPFEAMRITATGSVGIGSSAPDARLTVNGTTQIFGGNCIGGCSTYTAMALMAAGGGSYSSALWTGSNGIMLHVNGDTLTDTNATGTVSMRAANSFGQPTFAAAGALTITSMATVFSSGAPDTGTNVTATNTSAILINSAPVGPVTNSYGLKVNAQTGATNNYAAVFVSGAVGLMTENPSPGSMLDMSGATGTAFSSLLLPTGTSGTRPTTITSGMLRYNSGTPGLEAYYNSGWRTLAGVGGSPPTLSSCGTGASVAGTDAGFNITTGTGTVNSCGVTFSRTWSNTPVCVVQFYNSATTTAYLSAASTTAITITFTASSPSSQVNVVCRGY